VRKEKSPLGTFAIRVNGRTAPSLYHPAWNALNLQRTHLGRGYGSNEPQLEDSLAMDNHKKNLAYTARSLSLLLERDALADFSHFIPRNDPTDLLIFNPLPWERTISGFIPKNVLIPRGLNDDPTSSRHFIGRMAQPTDFWTGRAETGFHGGMGWNSSQQQCRCLDMLLSIGSHSPAWWKLRDGRLHY
jgi:hypothetical protein